VTATGRTDDAIAAKARACCKQDDTFVAEDVNSECCFLFREFWIATRGCAAPTMRDRDLRAAACVAGMLPRLTASALATPGWNI
jgi:hypothetical protein